MLSKRFTGTARYNKSYALVIGISEYTPAWWTLEAPVVDATRIRDFLIHDAGFDYVVTLTNRRATKERITKLMA